MREAGMFLLIYGCLSLLYGVATRVRRLAKWDSLRQVHGGKRQPSVAQKPDWVRWLGQQVRIQLSAERQKKLSRLLVWSGLEPDGKIDQFLGLCMLFIAGAFGLLVLLIIWAWSSERMLPILLGAPLVIVVVASPVLGILMSRSKRTDNILRHIPEFVLSIRRELARDANYIEAFIRAEADVRGVLNQELAKFNQYVRSTHGDVRTALAHFKERCGHRAIDLFCMKIQQGMDTDRVVEGLTELEQQMSNVLKDRVQKQTEKRNLMVFFGTIVAASILMLQGAFYGLMKMKEQMSSFPF